MFDSNSIKIEKILFSNCLKHRHKINGLVMLGLVPRLDDHIFVVAIGGAKNPLFSVAPSHSA
jgi:hypothetical protein